MTRWLRDYRGDAPIGIDTNLFRYHLDASRTWGVASTEFLERIGRGEVYAVLFSSILSEVLRLVQMHTALSKLGTENWQRAQLELERNESLAEDCQAAMMAGLGFVDRLCEGGLRIVDVASADTRAAVFIAREYLLLLPDAVHVGACRNRGIVNWASNDADFDRVSFLTRWQPQPAPQPASPESGVVTP